MAKKIYDIKPSKSRKTVNSIAPRVIKEKEREEFVEDTRPKKNQRAHKKESRPMWLPVSVTVLVILLILGVYLFFKLPKADIYIWPKVEILSFEQTITANKTVDLVDVAKAQIPAQYFQATKTNSQEFPATGNSSDVGLASGTIIISNKYDPPTPFTFKAGTRFISDSGKLFIALNKIVIPAATKVGNKITPGTVQIKVQAAEGGSDYNIAPAGFSIPGLKGTAYYYSLSATSESPMTGGYSGTVKKVTQDDISTAKDVLTKKTTNDVISDLKSQISSDYILVENAIISSITSASTLTKVGTVVQNFNYQVSATASALAFKKSDLDQFAKNYIISQMPEGKTLLDDNFKIDYSASVVDISGGKATLNLDFSSGVYQNIDKNSLSLSLMGKNADQARETINNSLGEGVLKIEIKLWPFWVTSVPNNQKVVNLELKFQ